jgi:hypothetical protein
MEEDPGARILQPKWPERSPLPQQHLSVTMGDGQQIIASSLEARRKKIALSFFFGDSDFPDALISLLFPGMGEKRIRGARQEF